MGHHSDIPSIWLLIAIQALSVLGDAFGQRCSRKDHKGSKRHLLITMSVVTALLAIIVFTIAEFALPSSITGVIYVNRVEVACYHEVDDLGHPMSYCETNPCHKIPCAAQGPGTWWKSVNLHPQQLWDWAINIVYYVGEVILYREPLGLVLLVLAALVSAFLVNPLNRAVGNPHTADTPALVLIIGIIGALFCIFERKPKPKKPKDNSESDVESIAEMDRDHSIQKPLLNEREMIASTDSDDELDKAAAQSVSIELTRLQKLWRSFTSTFRLLIPFSMLSFTYALWFVLQVFFNNFYHINSFGYNFMDRAFTPLYFYPFLFLLDLIPGARYLMAPKGTEEEHENFWQACKVAWKECSILNLTLFRFFIMCRGFAYFYLAVIYDVNLVYLELTLIRIVQSWLGAIAICLLIPKFAAVTPEERRVTFAPINLALKLVGTVLITVSLILLNNPSVSVLYNRVKN